MLFTACTGHHGHAIANRYCIEGAGRRQGRRKLHSRKPTACKVVSAEAISSLTPRKRLPTTDKRKIYCKLYTDITVHTDTRSHLHSHDQHERDESSTERHFFLSDWRIRSRGEGDLTRDVLSLRVLNYTLQVRLGVDIYSTECDLGHRLSSLVESMVVIANRSSLL